MPTLKDVAVLAGVSQATVSRFLNHDSSLTIPPETQQNILHAVQTLGYQKKVRKSRTRKKIGILQWYSLDQEILDPYYLSVRTGVEQYCLRDDVEIVRVFKSDSDLEERFREIDGLICIGKFSREEMETLSRLCPSIIFADMDTEEIVYNTISLDFHQALKDGLTALKDLGHERVGFVGGYEILSDNSIYPDARNSCFLEIAKELGLTYNPYYLIGDYTRESGYSMMKMILENPQRPTAMFCASDPLAMGVCRAIQEEGLKIPDDISVLGFDDIEECLYCSPPLSSIAAPALYMGELAAKLVINCIQPGNPPMRTILPCKLKLRQSVKNLKAK